MSQVKEVKEGGVLGIVRGAVEVEEGLYLMLRQDAQSTRGV